VFQDGITVVREGKGTIPFGARSENKDIILDTFTGGEDD
jgi:hypothetical protein